MFHSQRHLRFILASIVMLATMQAADAQTGRQRGATFGGLAGAIAGGLIGDHNDEAGAGAAIGGVVGAVAGSILGDAADQDAAIAQQRAAYYRAQQQQYAQHQRAAQIQSAVTMQDIVSMTKTGLSDQVILNQVRQRGYNGTLAVSDIISLHQQGVSENIITSLQTIGNRPAQTSVARPAPVVQRPTVIEHRYVPAAPVIIHERVLPHYPPPHYRRSSRHTFHFGY